MNLMMCEGKYVGRDEVATVPTPVGTASWYPVAHADVIDAVTEAVKTHDWQILDEQYGLARDGQRMFGVMRINRSSSPEWSRCIGIRNSHDQSLAVGLAAGVSVMDVLQQSRIRWGDGAPATPYEAHRTGRSLGGSGRGTGDGIPESGNRLPRAGSRRQQNRTVGGGALPLPCRREIHNTLKVNGATCQVFVPFHVTVMAISRGAGDVTERGFEVGNGAGCRGRTDDRQFTKLLLCH